jgi:hypothetical protein
LALVRGTIEVALRLGNESIFSDLPHLEATDANPKPSANWPGIGADECPVVFRKVALYKDVVHKQLHVRQRGHEGLSSLCDGTPTGRRSTIINSKRPI